MNNIHIKNFAGRHLHFVGIGGISMSGLAEILHSKGYSISGSDLQDSPITQGLKTQGIRVFTGHSGANVSGVDLVIYTAAVKDDNPELIEAHRVGIPALDRATLLGQIMETFSYPIGVAGTHGKTTTTSMLSIILDYAQLDPTILVGGQVDALGGNVRIGQSSYFLTEACEYVGSFLKFRPLMSIILNIDIDHLDYFKDIDHIYSTFLEYARLVPKEGTIIGCYDDPRVRQLLDELDCHTISYGLKSGSKWLAHDIVFDKMGCPSFKVTDQGKFIGTFSLRLPGDHNVLNALAAIAAASTIGVSVATIKEAILGFRGTNRRFEEKGYTGKGAMVIDDYAHHPTEIRATVKAMSNFNKKLWCVFQPHTYTRTKILFKDFTEAFDGVDHLIIADIFPAREKDPGNIHSRDLAKALSDKGIDCIYMSDFGKTAAYLETKAKADDLIITMGAGDIYKVGEMLVKN
ncbi:MAG TPA: UDP-N-acetylmuramate--L-alanine ligase [Bacillota bacterium]|nr:UDP-N-acetylmuramate--L-alanine ligase [Bacillota bacterium]